MATAPRSVPLDPSPLQQRECLLPSTAHGRSLGWPIDPFRRRAEVVRLGGNIETIPDDGQQAVDPVPPGLLPPVAEISSWLRPGR